MIAHEDAEQDVEATGTNNVLQFRPRHKPVLQEECAYAAAYMERFPVDIRGHVTFGRLMSGLASVGLTVRIDPRSGHVVITDGD